MRLVLITTLLLIFCSCGGPTSEEALDFAQGTNLIVDRPTREAEKLVRMTWTYLELLKIGLAQPQHIEDLEAQQEVTLNALQRANLQLGNLEEVDEDIGLLHHASSYIQVYREVLGKDYTELLQHFKDGLTPENKEEVTKLMEDMFSKLEHTGKEVDRALGEYSVKYSGVEKEN